jgi:hypothetical protein
VQRYDVRTLIEWGKSEGRMELGLRIPHTLKPQLPLACTVMYSLKKKSTVCSVLENSYHAHTVLYPLILDNDR